MLEPVCDLDFGKAIADRYTSFTSSVSSGAPMLYLQPEEAPGEAGKEIRYQTSIQDITNINQYILQNEIRNVQLGMGFLERILTGAVKEYSKTVTRHTQMLEKQSSVIRTETSPADRIQTAAATPSQIIRTAEQTLAEMQKRLSAKNAQTPHPPRPEAESVPAARRQLLRQKDEEDIISTPSSSRSTLPVPWEEPVQAPAASVTAEPFSKASLIPREYSPKEGTPRESIPREYIPREYIPREIPAEPVPGNHRPPFASHEQPPAVQQPPEIPRAPLHYAHLGQKAPESEQPVTARRAETPQSAALQGADGETFSQPERPPELVPPFTEQAAVPPPAPADRVFPESERKTGPEKSDVNQGIFQEKREFREKASEKEPLPKESAVGSRTVSPAAEREEPAPVFPVQRVFPQRETMIPPESNAVSREKKTPAREAAPVNPVQRELPGREKFQAHDRRENISAPPAVPTPVPKRAGILPAERPSDVPQRESSPVVSPVFPVPRTFPQGDARLREQTAPGESRTAPAPFRRTGEQTGEPGTQQLPQNRFQNTGELPAFSPLSLLPLQPGLTSVGEIPQAGRPQEFQGTFSPASMVPAENRTFLQGTASGGQRVIQPAAGFHPAAGEAYGQPPAMIHRAEALPRQKESPPEEETDDIQTIRRVKKTVQTEEHQTVRNRAINVPGTQNVSSASSQIGQGLRQAPAVTAQEVEQIAERVYKTLEKRLHAEKMRRGM